MRRKAESSDVVPLSVSIHYCGPAIRVLKATATTWLRRGIIALALIGLPLTQIGCAMGGGMVNHTFSFDTMNDSKDIRLLDYNYGGSRPEIRPDPKRVLLQAVPPGLSIGGFLPRGKFLYVKWQMIRTQEVYEDTVDLRSRLPGDIENLNIHFVINGTQLYVFLTYPWDGQAWEPEPPRTKYIPVPGGVKRYEGQKVVQIYPDPLQK